MHNGQGLTNGVGVDSSNVLRALEIIQNPQTDNTVRHNASEYLGHLKEDADAARYGYSLGIDADKAPLVRHFGLSLLEHVLRQRWQDLDDDQSKHFRHLILELGRSVTGKDPPFLRNKVAQLWIELAKRSWAVDWFNLDELLSELWAKDLVSKDFVLTVLENLSEDLFFREDSAAILRGRALTTALVDIFTSSTEHTGNVKVGEITYQIRYGDIGWLARINEFIRECLQTNASSNQIRDCLIKALATVRSSFFWLMTTSIAASGCLSSICDCLATQDAEVLLAAIESLLALYSRVKLEDADIEALVYPMCHPTNTANLQQLYAWSLVGIDEIDSPKYLVSKKLSELVAQIAEWLVHKPPAIAIATDFSPFLQFMVGIVQHQSLIVSIPIVHAWVKLLAQSQWRKSHAVSSCIGSLLQFACERTVQYDQIPEESNNSAVAFVHEEIELFPERQGFFINYRRLCCQIIELISYSHLGDAIPHIVLQVDANLDQVQNSEESFDPATYSRYSMAVLQADGQFSVVESAFKGFSAWRAAHKDNQSPEEGQLEDEMTSKIRSWSLEMMAKRTFKDPYIKQRLIKSAVETSYRVLQNDTSFALKVLEHILTALIQKQHEYREYSEAVDDLHIYATNELIRLAMHHSDYFITFYEQLESQIQSLMVRTDLDEKTRVGLSTSLFLVVQRATNVDPTLRRTRLWAFLEPVQSSWQDPKLQDALSSLENFAHLQGFDRVGPYMALIDAGAQQDWPNVILHPDGKALRDFMKGNPFLPLRMTRTMLAASTDKLSPGSAAHRLTCELWSPILPAILYGVLRVVSYNHELHDVSNWPNLPVEMRSIAQRVLQDRYWQSGISDVSIGDFQAGIRSSRESLEGLASAVRGRIRTNLEHCYSIVHTLGRLGDTFFNISQMPGMLAQALFGHAQTLSPHHFSVFLNMLPKLLEECQFQHRPAFLTPVLSEFLRQLDQKCVTEWQKLETRKAMPTQEDSLSEEMKEDSILRNMTYKAVSMVSLWIDPQRELKLSGGKSHTNGLDESAKTTASRSLRSFILSNSTILQALLPFCTHALSFRDTKSCSTIVQALRWLIPPFATPPLAETEVAAAIREYMSNDLLKAAITGLNDGHFVDQQRPLANLIATIWIAYGLPAHIPASEGRPAYDRPPFTESPRKLMLSLPNMTQGKVDETAAKLEQEGGINGNSKHQRALILSLLEDFKGVRLSELHKIDTSQQKNKLMEKYTQRENTSMQGMEDRVQRSDIEAEGVDLGGVSEMFGS